MLCYVSHIIVLRYIYIISFQWLIFHMLTRSHAVEFTCTLSEHNAEKMHLYAVYVIRYLNNHVWTHL